MDNLRLIVKEFDKELKIILAQTNLDHSLIIQEIKNLRKKFLGDDSLLKVHYQNKIKSYDNDVKKLIGQTIKDINDQINQQIKIADDNAKKLMASKILKNEEINLENDLFYTNTSGGLHPINAMILKIQKFFKNLGYVILDGQEVETNKYNFEYLNIPKNHPARNLHDSFFIDGDNLLRTHCTNMTAKFLESAKPKNQPIKIISFGNVYRKDEDDATHSHQFSQVDIFNIGENINLANLKWTLLEFLKYIFDKDTTIRLRPSFFPFTEPSLEVDINCPQCKGKGCKMCKNSGWIEILGAGMIHPNVIQKAGHSPSKIQGFAFGVGIERLVLIKYGITDIRHLYVNDLKFLSQFRFN